jgi:hypothetical protein
MEKVLLLAAVALLGALFALWARKPRGNDLRVTLGIKRTPGSMATPRNLRDTAWAQYETPTCMRRGMPDPTTEPVQSKTRKRLKAIAKGNQVVQATDAASSASFEVVA